MKQSSFKPQREFSQAMWLLLSGELSEQEQAYWVDYLKTHPNEAREFAEIKATLQSYDRIPADRAPESLVQDLVDQATQQLDAARATRNHRSSIFDWLAELQNKLQSRNAFSPKLAIVTGLVIVIGISFSLWLRQTPPDTAVELSRTGEQVALVDSMLGLQQIGLDVGEEEGYGEYSTFDESLYLLNEDLAYLSYQIESSDF